ncbi:sulfite exporter TauE/SafE family protein [Phaeobacter sp. JH18-32]|uniref:sulfite exporter TauE/SafE family protein n=1 Tax=Phaeobacter TaxID=302485 RepID=UPI003A892983
MSALTTSLVTTATLWPEPAVLAQMAGLLIVTGAVAGVLAGLLGVGGGIVLVPAFFYVFQTLGYGGDQLMQMCLATSLATIIVTSLRSVMSHNKKGAVDWDILRGWGPGIAIGAIVGVTVAASLRSTTLQALFGVLALVIGCYMAFGRSDWRLGNEMPKGARRIILSPMVGFLSVLMGIGGGSFGVPLMSLHATPIHRAVATAAGFGVIIAVPSVIGFLFLPVEAAARPPLTVGAVNLVAFVVVIAMTLITAPWGVKLAHAMDPKPLKRVFAVFLILVALNMLRKSLGF